MKLEKDSIFYRKLWSLMIPIVLQNLMLAMVAVADAFMLGGMDQNYMSAVSLATQIQFIQNMFLATMIPPLILSAGSRIPTFFVRLALINFASVIPV